MDLIDVCDANASCSHASLDVKLGSERPPCRYRLTPSFVTGGMQVADLVLLLLAVACVYLIQSDGLELKGGEVIVGGGYASAMTSFCLARGGAYRLDRRTGLMWRSGLILAAVSAGAALFALCLVLLHALRTGTIWLCAWAGIALLVLSGARGIWVQLLRTWKADGTMERRVAVVGISEFAKIFIEHASADANSGLRIVGLFTDDVEDEVAANHHVRPDGTLPDLVARSCLGDVDTIVLAGSFSDIVQVDRLRHNLRSVTADIYVPFDITTRRVRIDELHVLGGTPMIRLCQRPLSDWQQLQKTMFDRVGAALLLIAIAPALLLITLAIRLETPGPVLFRQARIGFNNQIFTIYKFRTMFHHDDQASLSGARQARREDPRITRVGKWLRRLSLDELPQLWNVLKGEMSLVGPRPHPPETRAGNRLFHDVVRDYAMRHRVRPGITGWAQVNGWRGETITASQIEQRVAHDLHYINNWSIWLDIRILLLTIVYGIMSKTAF